MVRDVINPFTNQCLRSLTASLITTTPNQPPSVH